MENLSMCRICLVTDVRLCSIASHLRDMYERITAMTFNREDRRPLVACYICHARLQNCYRLRTSCLRSEELYTVMMSSGVLVAQQHSSTNTFRTSSLLHFSLGHVLQNSTECHVKEEASEIIHDAELYQYNTEEIVTEGQEGQCTVVDANKQCSHENPLNVIKRELDDVETGDYLDINGLSLSAVLVSNCTTAASVLHPLRYYIKYIAHLKENHKVKIKENTQHYRIKKIGILDKEIYLLDEEIVTEAQEEQSSVVYDNNQYSHLKDPLDVIKRELDDEETVLGVEYLDLNIEDTIIEESDNPNDVGLFSQLADNICPKIVKVVLQRIDGNDTGRGADDSKKNKIVAENNTEDATTYKRNIEVTEVKTVIKKTEVHERVTTSKIPETSDKLDIKLNKCENVNNVCFEELANTRSLKHEVSSNSVRKYRQFSCDTCKNSFNSKNHVRINSGNKRNQCNVCKKYFPKKDDSSKHEPCQIKHHIDIVHKSNLKNHIRVRTGETPYQCGVCNKCFIRKTDIKTHYCTHTGEKPYQCDVCYKHFNQESHLKTHIRIHTGEKPYECDVCYTRFNKKYHLKTHIRIHTGVKPYQCDICNKRFNQESNLKTHIRIHTGEKPYECDVCNKCFIRKGDLNCHYRTHTDEKPYQCDVCNKRFANISNLKKHIRIHTGEKPYQCDVCNKCFIREGHLKSHYSTHTGEKPYHCDVCNKRFNQVSHLKTHIRIHTGEKPYECNVCNKRFANKYNLKTHIRIHTGEKPYQCDVCYKRFNQESHLKTHIRIHIKEKP